MKRSIFKVWGFAFLIILVSSMFFTAYSLSIATDTQSLHENQSVPETISSDDVDLLYNPSTNGYWYPEDNNTSPYFVNYENKYQKVWEPWLTKAAIHAIAVSDDGEFMAIAGGYLYDTSLHIYRYNPDAADYVHVWDVGSDIIKGDVMALAFGDTDNNRFMEIAAASTDGYIYVFEQRHVYDPYTRTENQFELVWKSDRMNCVFDLKIYDADRDGREDIIAAAWDNKIHVFEYTNHSGYPFSTEHWIEYTEVWNSGDTIGEKLTSMTVGDTNYNGLPEIIVGTENGRILVFENNGTVLYVEGGVPFPLPNDNEYELVWNSSGIIWHQIIDMDCGNFDNDPSEEVAIVAQGQGVYILDDYNNVTNTYRLHKLIKPLMSWEMGTGNLKAGHPLDHYVDSLYTTNNITNVFYRENETYYEEEPVYYTYLGGGKVTPNVSIIPFNTAMAGLPDGLTSWFNASSSHHPGVNATAILDFGRDEEATGNANDDPDIEILFQKVNGFMSSPNFDHLHFFISQDGDVYYQINVSDITFDEESTNFTVYLNIDNVLSEHQLYYARYLQINATDPTEKYAIDSIKAYYLFRPLDTALSVLGIQLYDDDSMYLEGLAYIFYYYYGKSVDYWLDYLGVNELPEKIVIGTVDGRFLVYEHNGTDYALFWESYEDERFAIDTNIWDIQEVRTTSAFPTWLSSFSAIKGTPIYLVAGETYSMHTFYDFDDSDNYLEMIVASQNGTMRFYKYQSGSYQYDSDMTNRFFYNLMNYYSSDYILTFALAWLSDNFYPEIVVSYYNKTITPSGNPAEDTFVPAQADIDIWSWNMYSGNYTRAASLTNINYEVSLTLENILMLSRTPPTMYFVDYDDDGDQDMVLSNGLIYLYENIGGSPYGRFKLVSDYFTDINRQSSSRIYSHPLFVNFDGDDDYDLIVGFANKLGITYFENEGTLSKPVWVEKMSAVTNMNSNTHLGMNNFTKPTLYTALESSPPIFEDLFGSLTWMTGYNNYTQRIVSFFGDTRHHNALMIATYPTVYRYDLTLITSDSQTGYTNFGAHIVKTWDNRDNLKNWTITLTTGDLDQDGKNEVIVGDFDNNLYVFEHLRNNTYKRAFKSPDIQYEVITDYSPYAWEELEGLSGEFNRTVWAHVTELYTGSDINHNGLEEIVAVADLAIYVFEHTGRDDRYSLIWQYDLRYSPWGEYLLANTSAHITALTVDNDIDYNGYGEIFVAVDGILFIFEYTPDGFVEQFASTNAAEGGRYDLPGNPNYLVALIAGYPQLGNLTIKSINALTVADTDDDGLKEIIMGGTLRELPCSDTEYGFAFILENKIGYYKFKQITSLDFLNSPYASYYFMKNTPVNDIAVGDQDYDGLKEIIIGHEKGITIYEYKNGTDNQYNKISEITSSPAHMIYPFNTVFPQHDYSSFVRGHALIELSNGTTLLFYRGKYGTTYRLYMRRTNSEYYGWSTGQKLFDYTDYPLGLSAESDILDERQFSVVQISSGVIWLSWCIYYQSGTSKYYRLMVARYSSSSGWQLFASDSSTVYSVISTVWEYPGSSYEVGIIYKYTATWVWYRFANSGGLSSRTRVPFIGYDKDYLATSFVATRNAGTTNLTFIFAGQFKNESKWDTDIWASVAYVNITSNTIQNWTTPTRITSDTTYEGSPSITQMKDTKTLLVVFESMDAFSSTVYASYSNDGGESWSRLHEMPTVPSPGLFQEYCYDGELYYKANLYHDGWGQRLILSFKTISPVVAARPNSGFLYSIKITGTASPELYIPIKWSPVYFGDILTTINYMSNWSFYDMGAVKSLAIGDSDRDNRAEILTDFETKATLFELNYISPTYHGYAQVWTSDDFGYEVTDVAIGDGNGNGYPELVISAEEGNVYSFEIFDKRGYAELFAPVTLWRTSVSGATKVYETDLGYYLNPSEQLLAVGTSSGIKIYANNGSEVFSKDFGKPVLRLTPYDMDSDGIDEIIILFDNGTLFCYDAVDNNIKWIFGDIPSFSVYTGFMYLEDVNDTNPGKELLIFNAYYLTSCVLYTIDPRTGNSLWNYTFASNNQIYSITFGNFTGSSHYNVIVVNRTNSANTLTIIDGNTNSTLHIRPISLYTYAVAILDINNDGLDDLVYHNGSTILAYNGTSDTLLWNTSSPVETTTSPYDSCTFAKVYYADNDSILDIALFYNFYDWTYSTYNTYILVLNGKTGKEIWHAKHSGVSYYPFYGLILTWTYHPTEPVIADVNGDGQDDIVEMLIGWGTNHKAFVLYNGDNGSVFGVYLTTYTVEAIGFLQWRLLAGDAPKIWDIDGHSMLDLVQISNDNVFNAFTFKHLGKIHEYTAPYVETHWRFKKLNETSHVVDIATGDVNGDGKNDVVYATAHYVYAVDGQDGSLLWSSTFASRANSLYKASILGVETAYLSSTTRKDVVLLTNDCRIIALMGNSSGTADIIWTYNLSYTSYFFIGGYYTLFDIVAAQFDGDSMSEIAVGGKYSWWTWELVGFLWMWVYHENSTILYFNSTGAIIDTFTDNSINEVIDLVIVNLTSDAYNDLVAITADNHVLGIDGAVRTSTLWDKSYSYPIMSFAVGDYLGGSPDDFLVGLNTSQIYAINGLTGQTLVWAVVQGYPVAITLGDLYPEYSGMEFAVLTDNGTIFYYTYVGSQITTTKMLTMIQYPYINYTTPNKMFSVDYDNDGTDELILINWNYVIAMNRTAFSWAYHAPDTLISAIALDNIEVDGSSAPKNIIVGTASGRIYVAKLYTTVSYQLNYPEIDYKPSVIEQYSNSFGDWLTLTLISCLSALGVASVLFFVRRKKKFFK